MGNRMYKLGMSLQTFPQDCDHDVHCELRGPGCRYHISRHY